MPTYEKSVFINCPYDAEFEPLSHAIVLTVAACGFTPRSARDSEAQAEPRISRIAKGMLDCKYSIHDLSRFRGEGPDNLARFNMPLELGIALGLRYAGAASARLHNWLTLVPPNFVHHKFISDLAGFDPVSHGDEPRNVIKEVKAWLSQQPDFELPAPSAKAIFDGFGGFCALLDADKAASLGSLTWPAILKHAQAVASQMPVA